MEWISVIDAALQIDIKTFVPGHGFIEDGLQSRQKLREFQSAIKYIFAEVQRLRDSGKTREEALQEANWGGYSTWMLSDSQQEIAINRIYDLLEGKSEDCAELKESSGSGSCYRRGV